jgi:hypothetical protein
MLYLNELSTDITGVELMNIPALSYHSSWIFLVSATQREVFSLISQI